MDGTIMLGFELDTKQLEDELKDLDKYQIHDKKLKLELDRKDLKKQLEEYYKERSKLDKEYQDKWAGVLKEKYMDTNEYKDWAKRSQMLDQKWQPQRDAYKQNHQTSQFIDQYLEANPQLKLTEEELQAIENKQRETKAAVEDTTRAIHKEAQAQKEVTEEVQKTKNEKKKENLQDNIDKAKKNSDKMKDAFSGIGMIIGGLALAGLASAIELAAENSEEVRASLEQVSTIVSNIGQILANLLLPLAEQIIDFIYQAVVWVGVLLEDWFGIDVFTASSSNNLKQGVKSARALRKQLMGFDEMNILNSQTGGTGALGSTGGAGGTGAKNKYAGMKPRDIADQFEKSIDESLYRINHDRAAELGFEVGSSIREWILENIPGARWVDEKIIEPIRWALYKTGLFEPIEPQIIEFNEEMLTTFEDLASKTDWSSQALIENTKQHFIEAKRNAEDGMIEMKDDAGNIMKLTEDQYFQLAKALGLITKDFTKEDAKAMLDKFNILKKGAKDDKKVAEESKKNWFQTINDTVKKMPEIAKAIQEGHYKIQDGFVEIKLESGETVKYTIDEFKKMQKGLTDVATGTEGAVTGAFSNIEGKSTTTSDNTKNSWIQTGNDIINKFSGGGAAGVAGAVTGALTGIETASQQGATGILNAFNPLPGQIKDIFNKLFPTMNTTGAALGGAVSGAMVSTLNQGISNTEKTMNKAIDIIRSLLRNMNLPGLVGAAQLAAAVASLKSVSLPRIKLAQGGIVNRPGPGVPVAGEYGREGVIPLDNNRQMGLLANEIAKRITFNLTSVLDVDGQELARITKQIMSDQEFASNGG